MPLTGPIAAQFTTYMHAQVRPCRVRFRFAVPSRRQSLDLLVLSLLHIAEEVLSLVFELRQYVVDVC